MSGCQEGILVDLSIPEEETLVTESIEFMRDASIDIMNENIPKYETPLKPADDLLNMTSNSSSPQQPSPMRFIEDETFDFDLPMTPGTITDNSTGDDEEDEVFFGPVKHKERCVSTFAESVANELKPLYPLKPHEMAEICKEANAVVAMIHTASGKKSKGSEKENVCVKQLNLSLKNNSKRLINVLGKSDVEMKENKMDVDISDNDVKLKSETDISDDSMKSLELFLRNEDVEQKPEPIEVDNEIKSETSSTDSPARKHNRSSTFTKDTTPIEKLPANKRRSLPVVEPPVQNLSIKNDNEGSQDSEDKSTTKLRQSKIQPPTSKLKRTSIPAMSRQIPAATLNSEESTMDTDTVVKSQVKTRLSAGKPSSLLPSKTKPVTTSKLPMSSSLPTKSKLPQKSALPGPKQKSNGAPMSKLQLIKPGTSQRLSGLQTKNNSNSTKKTGPMKAFAPVGKQDTDTGKSEVTPAKSESIVTRSSHSSFSTPTKEGSVSSVDSPVSSVHKRRSFLPTPNKTRSGSAGSCPSPCGSRGSSTSSMRSIESPLIGKRRISTSTANGPKLSFELIDDSSPSAMKQRRPIVTNTPNQPKKKLSPWSPIQRKKHHDPFDQAFACTKVQRK
ncbi:G-2 and S-phase expressed 1 [Mactra antiquata]